jgi:hypothetical protein
MSDEPKDLWPAGIRVSVRTPFMILRAQADFLAMRTKGLIKAELERVVEKQSVTINFDIMSAATSRYRTRLLAVIHAENQVYPAIIEARAFGEEQARFPVTSRVSTDRHRANTEDEFLDLVARVFSSGGTLSIIQSVLASTNEVISAESGDENAIAVAKTVAESLAMHLGYSPQQMCYVAPEGPKPLDTAPPSVRQIGGAYTFSLMFPEKQNRQIDFRFNRHADGTYEIEFAEPVGGSFTHGARVNTESGAGMETVFRWVEKILKEPPSS